MTDHTPTDGDADSTDTEAGLPLPRRSLLATAGTAVTLTSLPTASAHTGDVTTPNTTEGQCLDEMQIVELDRGTEMKFIVIERLEASLSEYEIIPGVTAADLNAPWGCDPDDTVVLGLPLFIVEDCLGSEWDGSLRDHLSDGSLADVQMHAVASELIIEEGS